MGFSGGRSLGCACSVNPFQGQPSSQRIKGIKEGKTLLGKLYQWHWTMSM